MAIENNKPTVIASQPSSEPSLRGGTTKQSLPLVPKLRFKEFEGEWENKTIENYIELISGYAFKGDEISENETGTPILRGINITEGYIRHSVDIDRYFTGNIDKYRKIILEEGDLVLGMDGSKVGKNVAIISKSDSGSLLIQRVARLRPKSNGSIKFIYHHIFSSRFHKYVDVVNTSSGIPHISSKQIKDFTIGFPILKEQQKIANFLTAVDTKIQQLNTKKEHLDQYKKGVMQQLFSQQLRFKPNESVIASEEREKQSHEANSTQSATNENKTQFPDWKKLQLSDLAERVKTKNKIDNQNVLTISAQLGLVSQLEYFNKSVAAKNLTGYYLLEKNDFAYNKSYSNGYPMGAIKRLKKYDYGVVSTLYICFRFNSKVSLDFMEQYFEKGLQNREIEKVAQEGARNHGLLNIGVNDFFEIDLKIPGLKEQQKIANYLSAIDLKIEAVNTQISNTQAFKKGLLQQMFV
ncbi:restriction endonuclease subunit S [Lacinutrix mariniflava]|uniref:restriction endonuclease subunit S n=1 Tax=Lacinutrix mariniflava TaxID=342955 RepID=UPI0006E4482C|nr:restriction endonuclease subunit S [Lacinutrix mariniflava]